MNYIEELEITKNLIKFESNSEKQLLLQMKEMFLNNIINIENKLKRYEK